MNRAPIRDRRSNVSGIRDTAVALVIEGITALPRELPKIYQRVVRA